MKITDRVRVWFLEVTALLSMLLVIGACGAGKSLEEVPLARGETILLKFWGPVTYSYRLKGTGGMVSYSVDRQDTISIGNEYSGPLEDPSDYSDRVVGYIRLSGRDENKFYFGYDTEVEDITGVKPFVDSQNITYRGKALLKNTKKDGETYIDPNHPITFQGKFLGATSQRKGRLCKSPSGETRMGIGVGPRSPCMAGFMDRELMDYKVDSTYHVEDLLNLWLKNNHNSMVSTEVGAPLVFIVQNVQALPEATATVPGTAEGVGEGVDPVEVPGEPVDAPPTVAGEDGSEPNFGEATGPTRERSPSNVVAQAIGTEESPTSGCSLRAQTRNAPLGDGMVWILAGAAMILSSLSYSRKSG